MIGEQDKEVADFLEKLLVAGQLRVQRGDDLYSVKIFSESVPAKGRHFLTKGGRIDD
ncbi:hypothetical protein [Rhizobium mongolense]|uniref:hypothetical protein n=1 Tax=Rhizobium mongolense TaxID=57676 RepID=UPI0034A1A269